MRHGCHEQTDDPVNSKFFESSSQLLVMDPRLGHSNATVLQKQAAQRGLLVAWSPEMSPNLDIGSLGGVAINTTGQWRILEEAFGLARRIYQHRVARATQFPITIVNCSREVSPSTRADFLRYGCCIVSDATPEQIIDLFETALVDARRRCRRGVMLVLRRGLPPLIMYGGRNEEFGIKGRLLSLLIALCREGRELSACEISTLLNCPMGQAKVYVDRLRRLIVRTGRKMGVSIGKHEVIQNSGRRGGYRLYADVRGVLPPNTNE